MHRRNLIALAALAATTLVAPLAQAQAKEIKIAIIASKTGPLEAYAKQTIVGFHMGLNYATNGTMMVAGKKLVVIEKDDQGKPDVGKAALAAAYAGKELGLESVARIEVTVDPNVYKNGVAVGVPGTGKVGLGIAAALGALIREPALELSVLSHITPALLVEAGILMDEGRVSISINDSQGLYVDVTVFSERSKVRAIIEGSHTNLVSLTHGDEATASTHMSISQQKVSFLHSSDATLAELIDVVEASSAQDFQFFEESIRMNAAAAQAGLDQRLGMAIGATFTDLIAENILSDDLINHAKILTASAADARMSGENIPVMSVAGSGNHGLTAILPVVAVAERLQIPRERLLKALAISSLTTIYIKRYTGNLSALCGCAVAAATGACASSWWVSISLSISASISCAFRLPDTIMRR